MKQNLKIRAAIHLSSTAVHTVVGYFDNNGKTLKIMAVGVAETDSFFGGQINDHQELLTAINKSVHEAMDMAGLDIYDVALSFGTPDMISKNNVSRINLVAKDYPDEAGRVVTIEDVALILTNLRQSLDSQRKTLFQVCMQTMQTERQQPVKNAVGMHARTLVTAQHFITLSHAYHKQLDGLFAQTGLGIHPPLFDGIVGAQYALSHDEKQRGVCFVDIGAGKTSVCMYLDNKILFSRCFNFGGQTVDAAIARYLNSSLIEAAHIKEKFGKVAPNEKEKSNFFTLKRLGTHGEFVINTYEFSSVIDECYYQFFEKIFAALDKEQFSSYLNAGIVLAGGASHIPRLPMLIERHFNVSVRKMNVNNCVSVCASHLNDDNIKKISSYLLSGTLHNAIGALLYQQSEQYQQDDSYLYSQVQPQGLFGRLSKQYHQWTNQLKKWM